MMSFLVWDRFANSFRLAGQISLPIKGSKNSQTLQRHAKRRVMRKYKIFCLLFLLGLASPKSALFKEIETERGDLGLASVSKTLQGDNDVVHPRTKRSAADVMKWFSIIISGASAACNIATIVIDGDHRETTEKQISK